MGFVVPVVAADVCAARWCRHLPWCGIVAPCPPCEEIVGFVVFIVPTGRGPLVGRLV